MEDQEHPQYTDSILIGQLSHFPESVTEWVFHESSNVFECSPFLCHISWLLGS